MKEPDIQCMPPTEEEEDDTGGVDGDKPKKKKAKKDPLFSKKTKSDPNAPPVGRMPLPNLYEVLLINLFHIFLYNHDLINHLIINIGRTRISWKKEKH